MLNPQALAARLIARLLMLFTLAGFGLAAWSMRLKDIVAAETFFIWTIGVEVSLVVVFLLWLHERAKYD